jgi:hypothetical protein
MTAASLPAALEAAAEGLYAREAATGLIIAHGTWLARDDFGCFIHHGTGTASIDWEAAIGALDAGELPSSGGEKRMLRLAASLADQAPVSLGEAITGIDDRNVGLLIRAVRHASGRRQFPLLRRPPPSERSRRSGRAQPTRTRHSCIGDLTGSQLVIWLDGAGSGVPSIRNSGTGRSSRRTRGRSPPR